MSGLSKLQRAVVELLKVSPEGLDIAEIREKLGIVGQQHLDKRVRDINHFYVLKRPKVRGTTIYILGELRPEPLLPGPVTPRLRAEVFHIHGRRCQMCGRTPAKDEVTLVVDHKIPVEWGGKSEVSNLEPLCEECNRGKRAYFASFDPEEMMRAVNMASVHERLVAILRMRMSQPVSSRLLGAVANAGDVQEDWHKRLRELRYTGLVIKTSRRVAEAGYTESFYTLVTDAQLPEDLTPWIRRYERERSRRGSVERRA